MSRRMEVSDRMNIAFNRKGSNHGLSIRTKEEIGAEVRKRQEIMKMINKAMKIGK